MEHSTMTVGKFVNMCVNILGSLARSIPWFDLKNILYGFVEISYKVHSEIS